MEISETVVISFLLIIIVILIFSNISVSFGTSDDNSSSEGTVTTPTTTNKIVTPAPTKFNPQTSDLLSNDIKKQLKDLDTMYYTNTCKA
jgi:hypothetical protein